MLLWAAIKVNDVCTTDMPTLGRTGGFTDANQGNPRGRPGVSKQCINRPTLLLEGTQQVLREKILLATFHRRDSRYFWIYQEDLLLVWPNQHADNLHGGLIWTYGHCHFGI